MGGAEHSESWWWRDLDCAAQGPCRAPLPGDREYDVAIVGGGYTGLWTAYYLAERDPSLRVAVVEQWVAGAGASSRNGGWCSSLLPVDWHSAARQYGRSAVLDWQAAADRTVDEIKRVTDNEHIDADFAKAGYLRTASNSAQLELLDRELGHAREWGRTDGDLRRLNSHEARAVINAPKVLGGLFNPHCASIQPAKLVRGLARAVEQRGVTIHEKTLATEISPHRITTDRGSVRADVIVQATEGYSAALRGGRRSLLPMYTTIIATEPLPETFWSDVGWRHRETFNDARRHLFYAQRSRDDRIVIGSLEPQPYRYGSKIAEIRGLDRVEGRLRKILCDQFPALAPARVEHRWGGVFGVPRDWMPSVNFDRESGLATVGGYSGDGVALTNLAGRTLADLITERDSELVHLPWVHHHSPRWEPEPLRWIGASLSSWLARSADAQETKRLRASRIYGSLFSRFTGH